MLLEGKIESAGNYKTLFESVLLPLNTPKNAQTYKIFPLNKLPLMLI